jgi:hypothetical protein
LERLVEKVKPVIRERRTGSLPELDEVYAHWRDRVALPRRHATGGHIVAERLQVEREALRALAPVDFDAAGRRSSRVRLDGYLKHGRCFYRVPEALVHQRGELRWDRDRVWIEHHGRTVAGYEHGIWQPAPRMRPEPPPAAPVIARRLDVNAAKRSHERSAADRGARPETLVTFVYARLLGER